MAQPNTGKPCIRHIANLWSLRDTPTAKKPWPLEKKIEAVKKAGFDGFTDLATPKHGKLAEKYGLSIVGYFSSAKPRRSRHDLQRRRPHGPARHARSRGDGIAPLH